MWSEVGWGKQNAVCYQIRFVCTKRSGVGFFRRVSRVMHLAVKGAIIFINWKIIVVFVSNRACSNSNPITGVLTSLDLLFSISSSWLLSARWIGNLMQSGPIAGPTRSEGNTSLSLCGGEGGSQCHNTTVCTYCDLKGSCLTQMVVDVKEGRRLVESMRRLANSFSSDVIMQFVSLGSRHVQ